MFPRASRPPENAATWVLTHDSFPHPACKPAGAVAEATRLLPPFLLLLTAVGGPVQTKGFFPWRSEGNLSLELGMQSFVLGQRSKPWLFVLHCERLFYIVPIHSPSVQGMGTVICANSHRHCKNSCIKDEALRAYGHMDIRSRKRWPRSYRSLCHVSHSFYLKFHWLYREMPFRRSNMPMHSGLLDSIK